jgi:hypothetical protein
VDLYEEHVLQYLTMSRPEVFVSPQYEIGKNWSCPDFVALDFGRKVVSVVEVSVDANAGQLRQKIEAREKQWFSRLRAHLLQAGVTGNNWQYHLEVFVRDNVHKKFEKKFRGQPDITIHSLEKEDIPFSWNWKWPRT